MNQKIRIQEILNYSGLRRNTLAKTLGYTNSAIFYQIEVGRNGISSNLANRICEKFPEINHNWILTGKGQMLKSSEVNFDHTILDRLKLLENHIKGQDARIEKLENLVIELTAEIPKIDF
ncbi:helix-turn-helix domain-containing protein [Flavobacteriaceae bacterium]|nr:helix-turn-helix domain-containing protein [Flavobacteriaceae bacterium]MDA7797727.1 helix-turn-helix domain-containing protein [Flavobacteriaceae bacterium]MDA9015485.1 helix-turn-helix domain-containing protein [Flavobacteriaceae bacterium]MDA9571836.1 helix-turn-helix domain-containing protein [Flavobacteriaceae bacterium]MDB3862469.1 helix-turn-helix domain-containing protein [Flavobacteriaceae bacterium]